MAPLAIDCTPTLKSVKQDHQELRTKNLSETRVHSVILSFSLCVDEMNLTSLCMSVEYLYILYGAPKLFVYEVT